MNAVRPSAQWSQVRYGVTQLGGGVSQAGASYPGGLDQTTPSLRLQPGALRDVLNFECAQSGGYSRIGGYERYDGRAAPSAAVYQIVQLNQMTNIPVIGNRVTQNISGAAGTVCGAVFSPDPYIVLTNVVGTFDNSHGVTINVSHLPIGIAVPQTVEIGAQAAAQYTAAAADIYRALIGPVPGSGGLLDVVATAFGGVDHVYAFRADVAGTAVAIYKGSASGWTLVPLFNVVDFTTGAAATPVDGETLDQGGVSAVIKRVMWQSGAWTGTAVGTFVITDPTGGNFAAGAATTSGGATVSLAAVQAPIVIAPGGTYEHVKCNFSGQSVTRRIYGCDGVNKCFEFDGETYAPITTGLSPDAPAHITFHRNYLVVAQKSSIVGCGAGTPFKWDSVDGGWEIATGDTVTGMLTLPGSQTTATLGVYLHDNSSFLYGTDPTTFNYVMFNAGVGALPRSVQNLSDTFILDSLGVITIRTTLNYGNFLPTALTKNILPFIIDKRGKFVTSSIVHDKSQYRLFFSDGYALWLTMVNQQYLGAAVILFPNPVSCMDTDNNLQNAELAYFGSSDGGGYVYQMDVGTSFDGADINASITLAWDPLKSPRILKRFRAASIEVQGNAYASIQFGYQLGYGSPLIGQPAAISVATAFAEVPTWDAFTWDNFVWDGRALEPSDVDVTGTGENIQVMIASGTNYMAPYTLDSVIHHFSMRRGIRV